MCVFIYIGDKDTGMYTEEIPIVLKFMYISIYNNDMYIYMYTYLYIYVGDGNTGICTKEISDLYGSYSGICMV
jgi:hypothetical protein